MTLHWFDYAIVLIPFVLILFVAWRTGRYMKSVADFMSAGRCAGRYLICIASGEAAFGAISVFAGFEYVYKAGFAIGWWQTFALPITLLITLTGFVLYRYRETRVLTLAQFFEVRYSRNFRVFAGMMAFLSGLLFYGIFPGIVARFFVNYCGLPQTLSLLGHAIPTSVPLMFCFLGFAVFLTVRGGQLTVMVISTLEGMLSGVFYIIVAIAMLRLFHWPEIAAAMAQAPKGQSLLNPFDTAKAADFNIWFVLIGLFGIVYGQLAFQGGHAFRSSAASAHEAKMGAILGNWRVISFNVMIALLAICAFTYLHSPDFAAGAARVQQQIKMIPGAQMQEQMTVPVALAFLLPPGIKGVFAAIIFFAAVSCDTSYMHSWGSIFIQDVILPFRKTKAFTPEQHIRLLRWSIVGVAVFAFSFSLLFQETEYILMYLNLVGAVFVAGAWCAIIGGLYWKKGTAPAAWAGMITGSSLALGGFAIQQAWKDTLAPALLHALARWQEHGGHLAVLQHYLMRHTAQFPMNGMVINFWAMFLAASTYAVVSLLTCKENFNMDRMLHRGPYAIEGASPPSAG